MRKSSILLFVLSLLLCGYSKSLAQDKIVLPVTYSATNANMLSLWVGKDGGYFDEQGLDVRMLLIRGGSLAVQLLVTGQSPVGLIGGTSAAYAYMQGNKDIVVISRLQNVMAYTLGAKPEINDLARVDTNVAQIRWETAAVINASVFNDQVVFHRHFLS